MYLNKQTTGAMVSNVFVRRLPDCLMKFLVLFPEAPVARTQMDRRKSGTLLFSYFYRTLTMISGAKPKTSEKSEKDATERPEGWLWQLGKLTKMSDTEMEAWSNEGGLLMI